MDKEIAFIEFDGDCVCEVLLWDIRAEGPQWWWEEEDLAKIVVVAKNMRIIKEIEIGE